MIIQHRYCNILNHKLKRKEDKKKPNRQKIFVKGKGRLLTDPAVVAIQRESEESARQKKVDVALWKDARATKAEQKAQKARATARKCAAYDAAMFAWNKICEALKSEGVSRNKWLTKLLYPFRKKIAREKAIDERLVLLDGSKTWEECFAAVEGEEEDFRTLLDDIDEEDDEENEENDWEDVG